MELDFLLVYSNPTPFFNDQIKKTLSTLNGLLKASDFTKTKPFLVQSPHYLLCPMESFEKQNGLKTPGCLEHRKMFLACKKIVTSLLLFQMLCFNKTNLRRGEGRIMKFYIIIRNNFFTQTL